MQPDPSLIAVVKAHEMPFMKGLKRLYQSKHWSVTDAVACCFGWLSQLISSDAELSNPPSLTENNTSFRHDKLHSKINIWWDCSETAERDNNVYGIMIFCFDKCRHMLISTHTRPASLNGQDRILPASMLASQRMVLVVLPISNHHSAT